MSLFSFGGAVWVAEADTPPVLIQFNELKVFVPVYPGVNVDDPVAYAVAAACNSLTRLKLALPVPFELVFYRSNGGGSIVIDREHPTIKGMVNQCAKVGGAPA